MQVCICVCKYVRMYTCVYVNVCVSVCMYVYPDGLLTVFVSVLLLKNSHLFTVVHADVVLQLMPVDPECEHHVALPANGRDIKCLKLRSSNLENRSNFDRSPDGKRTFSFVVLVKANRRTSF